MERTSVSAETQKLASLQTRRNYRLKAVVGLLALSAVVATFAVFNYSPAGTDFDDKFDPSPCSYHDFKAYEEWIDLHTHKFSLQEKEARFTHWCKNHQKIAAHNKDGKHSFKLGHHKYSHESFEEFLAAHTGLNHKTHQKKDSSESASQNSSNSTASNSTASDNKISMAANIHQKISLAVSPANRVTYPNTPVDVDWRAQGVVSAIKDQKSCGSCWTFAAAATLESFYALQGHRLSNFSEQYFVECMSNADGSQYQGCSGGLSDVAMNFAIANGIPLLTDYPYTGRVGTCSLTGVPLQKTGAQVVRLISLNNSALIVAALSKGPIVVYINCPETFHLYGGGLYNDPTIDTIVHAVTLVGYHLDTPAATSGGTFTLTSDETDLSGYYILRNSWATSWGENGYARIAITNAGYGAGTINIHSNGISVSTQ